MKKVIGLTGGIATGKSTVTAYLRQKGFWVIDADQVVHDLQKPDGPLSAAIRTTFGAPFFLANGNLDRKKLSALIFSDTSAQKKLSAMTETIVRPELLRQREAATGDLVFMDIPLLFEQDYTREVDETWLIAASEATQIMRLKARNGLSDKEARARLSAQMPLDKKRSLATHVIENTETCDQLYTQIDFLLQNA